MGIIQSIICSISFCVERILTYLCCAIVLILLLFTIIMLMIYGISVGYHYAQKELAAFAYNSRSTEGIFGRRAGLRGSSPSTEGHFAYMTPPGYGYLRQTFMKGMTSYLGQNQENATYAGLESYRTKLRGTGQIFWDLGNTAKPTPRQTEEFLTETSTDLAIHEQELARRLLGRVRRSRNDTKKYNLFKRLRKYA